MGQTFNKLKNFIISNPSIFIFLFTFFYLLLWIPLGIDMTDEGKQMSIAWNIFNGTIKHSYDINKYGSWFINGLWLSILDEPLLIWARVGGVLLMSLMTLFAYLILYKYNKSSYTVFVVVVTLLLVICENHPETKIDHSNLPVLLALIFIFFMLLTIESRSLLKFLLFILLAYFSLIFSIWTRFPHLFFLPFPFIFYILYSKTSHNEGIKKFNLIFHIPIFAVAAIFLNLLFIKKYITISHFKEIYNFFIYNIGSFKDFFLNLSFSNLLDYQSSKQFSYLIFLSHRYFRDTVYILVIAVVFLIILILYKCSFNIFINKIKNQKIKNFIDVILVLAIFFFLFLKPWFWYMAIFAYIVLYLFLLKINNFNLKDEFFYLYWGFLLFFISFIGSNNSYRHSFPAGAIFLIVPIVALINHKRKDELINKGLSFLNKFTYIFIVAIMLFSFTKKIVDDNKRDTQPIFTRNVLFKSRELSGITSNRSRVEAIDGLIYNFKKISKKEDTVLCFNSVPMLYYLLNKDYFLDDPWLIPYGLDKTENELEYKASQNIFPDYIIFSKKNAQEDRWPETDIIAYKKDQELYDYILSYINRYQYKDVYQNSAFVLYKR